MSMPRTVLYLPYRLQLRSPAIVTAHSADPNSAATQTFVPGSALRGAVAARLLNSGADAAGEGFRRLILSGAVRYLNAYPEIGGARSLPTPVSWRHSKYDEARVVDLALREWGAGPPEEDGSAEASAALAAPFMSPTRIAGEFWVGGPERDTRVHHQRDRAKGRAWLEKRNGAEIPHGAVFVYEYLEAGQIFRGAVQIMDGDQQTADRLGSLLDGATLLLGRSRRAGYGGEAQLEFEAPAEREYPGVSWFLDGPVHEGRTFGLLLTAAYLGRHPETGQLDPAALDVELEEALDGRAQVVRRYQRFELAGGFNKKWRLELPQGRATAGGSVVVLEAAEALEADDLRRVEHEGLGERRVEGFGRCVFFDPAALGSELRLRRAERSRPREAGPAVVPPGGSEEGLVQFTEQRIVLRAARAEIERLARELIAEASQPPPNSLLGRLRNAFRAVRDHDTAKKALETLRRWCPGELQKNDREALKEAARGKLQDCRLTGGESLFDWLRRLSDGSREPWERLRASAPPTGRLGGLPERVHLTDAAAAHKLLEDHAALLLVELIDTALAGLARRNRRRTA